MVEKADMGEKTDREGRNGGEDGWWSIQKWWRKKKRGEAKMGKDRCGGEGRSVKRKQMWGEGRNGGEGRNDGESINGERQKWVKTEVVEKAVAEVLERAEMVEKANMAEKAEMERSRIEERQAQRDTVMWRGRNGERQSGQG